MEELINCGTFEKVYQIWAFKYSADVALGLST